jgi:hypothetical protein
MTGTGAGAGAAGSFSAPPKGCISPLDLFSSPGNAQASSFANGSLPGYGNAYGHGHGQAHVQSASSNSSPHNLVPGGGYSSLGVSINGTPALGTSGFGLSGLGFGEVDTPVDMESAPDTNLASPLSSDDGDDKDDEGDDDDEPMIHVSHAPNAPHAAPNAQHASHARAHTDTITLKIPRSPMTAKALALDPTLSGEVAPPVKKRSRTAQACERCRVRKARVSDERRASSDES